MESGWLHALCNTNFHTTYCDIHKNKVKNSFCILCNVRFCKDCTCHYSHANVRIYKFNNAQVVRVEDMDKYFPCTEINRVDDETSVFIKPRTSRKMKLFSHRCVICNAYLKEGYRFCSIACKNWSIGTSMSSSPKVDESSNEEETFFETYANELESTISIEESTEETKGSHERIQFFT